MSGGTATGCAVGGSNAAAQSLERCSVLAEAGLCEGLHLSSGGSPRLIGRRLAHFNFDFGSTQRVVLAAIANGSFAIEQLSVYSI